VKHINTRFPDELHDAVTDAAVADRRPIGAWVRIACEEKLARDRHEAMRAVGQAMEKASETLSEPLRNAVRQVEPNFKKGGKK
jgi:hypothetical protein